MKPRDLLQYRKDPRLVIAAPVILLIATSLVYYLVERAKELSPEALSSRLLLFVLWNINLILIFGILFVLLRGVIKLLLERQRGIIGSRFRTKLVITYVATSLVPIVLLFFVATDLLRVSIDRWFNTPVRSILHNSEAIADADQKRVIAEASRASQELAESIAKNRDGTEEAIAHVRRYHAVDVVGTYQKRAVVKLIADPRAPVYELREPSSRFFDDVAQKGWAQKLDETPDGKWVRFGRRVGNPSDEVVAVAGIFLPNTLSRMIDENLIASRNFQQLNSQRSALKASQTSLFLTVTLYILFGALWTAIFASRRIAVPIQALAEGTRTLAEGNYAHRITVHATDEFGLLINSFNTMAEELGSQREALTESNTELQKVNLRLDREREYLSTVLESVSSGIIAFTHQYELLSINRAAMRMLQLPVLPPRTHLERQFEGELASLRSYVLDLGDRPPRPREITVIRGGELRYLEVSAERLTSDEGGWVLAIEDSTQLVQAQKLAAWSEAARRIAHEIKNPLTPIQLSAERIARKFRSGDDNVDKVIDEGTRTIINEVGQLKRMVDEFSRFARMPAIHLRETAISNVLQEVAGLYHEVKPGVSVSVDADPQLRAVVDPEQIRRAMINLLDNAVEATGSGVIEVAARKSERKLMIRVSDPGRGVSDADKERLFLPYFSTKGRGTGLGLAIVHRIVHDHDGRISVHDNQPRGTTFQIELPA